MRFFIDSSAIFHECLILLELGYIFENLANETPGKIEIDLMSWKSEGKIGKVSGMGVDPSPKIDRATRPFLGLSDMQQGCFLNSTG